MAEMRAASRSALRGAVVEMADLARFHLHRASDNQSDVPKEGRAALLPAVCGLHYLDALGGGAITTCCTPRSWEQDDDEGTMTTTTMMRLPDPGGGDLIWA